MLGSAQRAARDTTLLGQQIRLQLTPAQGALRHIGAGRLPLASDEASRLQALEGLIGELRASPLEAAVYIAYPIAADGDSIHRVCTCWQTQPLSPRSTDYRPDIRLFPRAHSASDGACPAVDAQTLTPLLRSAHSAIPANNVGAAVMQGLSSPLHQSN
jgi:hypothetical protein